MRNLLPLAVLLVFAACSACASDPDDPSLPGGSTTPIGLDVYAQPCDLSSVAVVEHEPDSRMTIENGRIHDERGNDITDLIKPLLCLSWPSEQIVAAAEGGFYWNDAKSGTVKYRAREIIDGERTRMTYEVRTLYQGQLIISQVEFLRRTRSLAHQATTTRAGTDHQLDVPADQLGVGPGRTYLYTFK